MLHDDVMDCSWRDEEVPAPVYEEYSQESVYEDDSLVDSERIGVRNKTLGRRGEAAAARYLEFVGYEILERNWVCPAGEADIIARQGETLVFVEVKTRTGIQKGFPAEAVTPGKRARYEKIAAWYLCNYGEVNIPIRFDVIALLVLKDDRAMVKHYVNAFGWER